MEHKFIIEVILKYEGPQTQEVQHKVNPTIPNLQNIKAFQVDPKMVEALLGPVINTLLNTQSPQQ